MSHLRALVRGVLACGVIAAVSACSDGGRVVAPRTPSGGALFKRYVSIGNSIAAGVQSGGINDSTQQQSFAFLIAQQMGTRFAVPFFPRPGCTPPIANWVTGAVVQTGVPTGAPAATGSTCTLRATSSAGVVLNNVAVPSAASTEVDALTSPFHNTLTTLILGGETQVQRAVEVDPTFVSIEIGPNDVLQAAATGLLTPTPGISRGITPFATFQQNYDKMIADLTGGAKNLKGGVLLANIQTSAAPLLFPAVAFLNPTFLNGFSQAAGGAVTVLPNCTPTTTTLVSFAILPQMKAGTHPRIISCEKTATPPLGDIFILDSGEQATLTAAINQMNTYIQGKANAINFAYVDINPVLLAAKQSGCISTVPNLAAAANPTTQSPFGTCVSFDGVHPTLTGQKLIANAVIAAINAKYSTTLAPVP